MIALPVQSKIMVEAPATSANLGPGFDVLALALAGPIDRLQIDRDDSQSGLTLEVVSPWPVASSPSKNAAGAVATAIAKDFGVRSKVKMKLTKGVQVGVGLGSSAASSICAVKGMCACFDLKISEPEQLLYAAKGEEVSSGTGHFDNVSASLFGGVTVVRNGRELGVSKIRPPRNIAVCIATPAVSLPRRKTEFARSLLPRRVLLEEMSNNVSLAASLALGFERGDIDLIGRGMHDDIVEPARSKMVPGYEMAREGALGAGASGVCISGAGPSLLAVYDRKRANGKRILLGMKDGFSRAGVRSTGFETDIGDGARVVAPAVRGGEPRD